MRRIISLLSITVTLSASVVALGARPGSAALDGRLTRSPYLTDLVGTSVTVNWATDRSALATSRGYVKWGPASGGSCSLTQQSADGSRTNLAIGRVCCTFG